MTPLNPPTFALFLFLSLFCLARAYVIFRDFNSHWQIGCRSDDRIIDIAPLSPHHYHLLAPRHSCYRAVYESMSTEFCYPSMIVAGVGKCGTSAAYQMLSSHPSIVGGNHKEACITSNQTIANLWRFFQDLAYQTELANNRSALVLLSGCIALKFDKNMVQILKHPKTVYIIMTRDLTDYLWASYNYWCTPVIDSYCNHSGRHTLLDKHTRSPELFHIMLLAKLNDRKVPTHSVFDSFPHFPSFFGDHIVGSLLQSGVPREAVVVCSSEQMANDSKLFWHRVFNVSLFREEALLGSHPLMKTFSSDWRVNVGDSKGTTALSHVSELGHSLGTYNISGYRPVLNASRTIIDKLWIKDCVWVSIETGFKYSSCGASIVHF